MPRKTAAATEIFARIAAGGRGEVTWTGVKAWAKPAAAAAVTGQANCNAYLICIYVLGEGGGR